MKVGAAPQTTDHADPSSAPYVVEGGQIRMTEKNTLRFFIKKHARVIFAGCLIGLLVASCVLIAAGIYGLASDLGTVAAISFVSSALLVQGSVTVVFAALGLYSMRMHHNFLLGIFFSMLTTHILIELAVAVYAFLLYSQLSYFTLALLTPEWVTAVSTNSSAIAAVRWQQWLGCCGLMGPTMFPAAGCSVGSGCATALADYIRPRGLYAGVAVAIFGVLQICAASMSWALRNQNVRLMENAPLRISTDPLALDAGDTALSDVWSDKPMSSGAVAKRLTALKSRTATKYALPVEDGGTELWEKLPEARTVTSFAGADLIGSMRVLLRSRADGPVRNPLAESDSEEEGMNSLSAQARHTQTMYKFGY